VCVWLLYWRGLLSCCVCRVFHVPSELISAGRPPWRPASRQTGGSPRDGPPRVRQEARLVTAHLASDRRLAAVLLSMVSARTASSAFISVFTREPRPSGGRTIAEYRVFLLHQ